MATLAQFMAAISGQESGGDFTAENLHSGAYGQYQIMPYNWPVWAEEAGLGRDAPQTQGNQNIVAAYKMQQYYDQYGDWGDVASLWYSGQPLDAYTPEELTRKQYTDGNEYPSIQEYVDSVLGKVGLSSGSYSSEQLPFGEKEYLEKYVRYQTLLDQYNRAQSTVDPLTGAPQAFDPNLLNEMFTLEYELSEYDRIKSEGGTGLDDELARLDYWNKNNPALIDAQNSANEWARQQTLNDMAQSGTRTALQEQRLTQDSANAETAMYKGSSVFTAPMGFRVGSTDLPTEDEVFAKQMEMASSKLPEVKPIPYAAPYPVQQQQPRTPSAPTQSFGKLPTEDDFRSAQQAFKPPPSTEGQWQGPINPRGSSVFRAVTNPLDAIRSSLLGSNPTLTTRNPVATALPTPVPSRTPTPTGTPTPPSVLSPYSQESRVAAGLRRYVGSIFGGR